MTWYRPDQLLDGKFYRPVANKALRLSFPAFGRGLAYMFGAALLLRVVAIIAVPLIPVEAYYWLYTQHPALSYFDHPPMVAWIIYPGTLLFGNIELGVRFVPHLLMLGSSVLMYHWARFWYGRRPALLAALLLQVLPMFYFIGFFATMDSALIFFWMGTLVGLGVVLARGQAWGWYVAGVSCGLAFSSKYTAIFLPACVLLTLIGHPPWRRHLRTVHPYLAMLLAAAITMPVFIWNAQHEWVSLRFQFLGRFGKNPVNLQSIAIFFGVQVAVLTPLFLVIFVMLVRRWCVARRRGLWRPRHWVAFSMCVPILLVTLFKALRTDIHINWTAPLYLSMVPAMSSLMLIYIRRWRMRRIGYDWHDALAATMSVCLIIACVFMTYLLVVQPRTGWIHAFGPWRELAAIVEFQEDLQELRTGRKLLVIADGKNKLASVLAFYRLSMNPEQNGKNKTVPFTTSQWVFGGYGVGFPYWANMKEWIGRDAIMISDGSAFDTEARPYFESVEPIEGDYLLTNGHYYMHLGRGLRASPANSKVMAKPETQNHDQDTKKK